MSGPTRLLTENDIKRGGLCTGWFTGPLGGHVLVGPDFGAGPAGEIPPRIWVMVARRLLSREGRGVFVRAHDAALRENRAGGSPELFRRRMAQAFGDAWIADAPEAG